MGFKIAYIQDNAINESLALTELAGLFKYQGYDRELFIEKEEADLKSAISVFSPDCFIIPSDIGSHHWTHRIASWCKENFNLPVIIGGTYPSFYPDKAFSDKNIDYLCMGEAEIPLNMLLNAILNGQDPSSIEGLWGHRSLYFILIRFPIIYRILRSFLRFPLFPLIKFFSFFSFFAEKQVFNIGFIEGFKYYLHTGNPYKRTKNFITLI